MAIQNPDSLVFNIKIGISMCETISKNLILRKFSLKMTIFHQLSYFHIIMPILIWKHHVHVWTFYIPIRFSVHCESRGCNRIANHKDWAWSSICHLDQKYSAFLRFVLWSLKPCLLHFAAFFRVTSLFSTGVDNEKALELTNSTVFYRGIQWKSSRAGQQNNNFTFQPGFNIEISPQNATKHPAA